LPSASKEIYDWVQKQSLNPGILVNNAGYGASGRFAETDIKSEIEMMQVNMISLVELTKYFLQDMIEKKKGRILNVASTAAFAPGPLMSIYYATKAFVLSFSEALSNELKGTGITVTALCPGPTRTGFQERANLEKSRLFSLKVMNARTVALKGYKGLMKGKAIVIPGLFNKLLILSVRLSPRTMVAKITRWMQESRKS
jgi:short-subunit dehydrogenase